MFHIVLKTYFRGVFCILIEIPIILTSHLPLEKLFSRNKTFDQSRHYVQPFFEKIVR